MLASPNGVNNVDVIFLDVLSVGVSHTDPTGCLSTRNYGKFATAGDLSVDNLKAVPEPAIHALLGLDLGLAGIGYQRRKQVAS